MPDVSDPRTVYVIDDYADYRNSLVENLSLHGIQARACETGEEFLALWRWGVRGVISLDINFDLTGSMDGLALFDRLQALRCPMPIVFVTGPYGHSVVTAVELARRRPDIQYLPKDSTIEHVRKIIVDLLDLEPRRFEEAQQERDLLHTVIAELTAREREILSLALKGRTNKEIAIEAGGNYATIEHQRTPALQKFRDVAGPTAVQVAEKLSPLLKSHGATDLVDLAVRETIHRLKLLDATQQALLEQELRGQKSGGDRAHGGADRPLQAILELLQAEDVVAVRRWLKWLANDELEAASKLFGLDGAHRGGTWLRWVAAQGKKVDWPAMPEGR